MAKAAIASVQLARFDRLREPGPVDRHRAEGLADRTSFTRFRVLSSAGTWYGVDPAAQTAATPD